MIQKALTQPGWNIDQGQATIVEEGIDENCVRVEPSPEGKFGQVTFKLDPPPELSVLFVDFYFKPVAFSEGPEEFADVTGSVTGAFRLVKDKDTDKNTAALYVLNGNGLRGGDWLETGVTLELDDEGRPLHWMRLTFRQEFAKEDVEGSQSRWDLWVDGLLVRGNLSYYDEVDVDPGRITLLGHRNIPLLLDTLTVSSENPLFPDENRDGLSDTYEAAYKLQGRDADSDDDQLSNLSEFILRTNPIMADSDGDGMNDGEEISADPDPLSDGDRSEALPFSFGDIANGTVIAYCSNMFAGYSVDYKENYSDNEVSGSSWTNTAIRVEAVRVYNSSGSVINWGVENPRKIGETVPSTSKKLGFIRFPQSPKSMCARSMNPSIANIFDHRVTRTYLNGHGQQIEVIHAYGTKFAASEHFRYNEDDRLIQHIDPDGVTMRYAYNHKGERVLTALDLKIEPNEAPNHIDLLVDRITRTNSELTDVDGSAVRRTTTQVFTETGLVTTFITQQALDGTFSATTQNGQRATRQRIEGENPGQWSIITTQPDQSHTIKTYREGQLERTTRHASDGTVISWTSQAYDGFGRPWQMTDSRTGTTTYHYDGRGRHWKVSAPNPKTGSQTEATLDTIYHFDALGQVIAITKPGGGQVHSIYNASGTLHKTHGHHTTDVEHRHNGRGERTHMITFYGPESKPARTRWHYNVRGQLAFKQDAAGKRVHYTYTDGGKLESRTWARATTTTYHYDPDNRIDLRHIDYSDNTPDVHFTYTRLGLKQTVQDAGGLLTYAYDPEPPASLVSETRSDRSGSGHTSGQALYAESKTLSYNLDQQLSQYSYAYNPDGHRTSRAVDYTETAYHDRYFYDPDTGGVSHAWRYTGTDPPRGQRMRADDHTFAYDKIGNRQSTTHGEDQTTLYDTSALNQYTKIIGDKVAKPRHDADGNLILRGDRSYH
jgi:YD repeat-containing protein